MKLSELYRDGDMSRFLQLRGFNLTQHCLRLLHSGRREEAKGK